MATSPPTILAPEAEVSHDLAQLEQDEVETIEKKVDKPDSSDDDGDEQGDAEHRRGDGERLAHGGHLHDDGGLGVVPPFLLRAQGGSGGW